MRGLSATVALAACLVAVGCGARSADEGAIDAKGILVFSGLPSPPFLHSIRPDGSDLRGVALPKTCSPDQFVRGGRVLVCLDLGDEADLDHWRYAIEREGPQWRRMSMPDEVNFPAWADPFDQVEASQWAPAGDRIAFVQPTDEEGWFSSTGNVTVADADGSNRRVVDSDGEVPKWSPDGKRLAFARCNVSEDWLKEAFADRTADCSLWTVSSTGADKPTLLAENVSSEPVWSPDGRFVAYVRTSGTCESFCRSHISIVPSKGGEAEKVGPELVQTADDQMDSSAGLAWLPESAAGVAPTDDGAHENELELQRCADIWNRARMHPYPTGAVNVSLVGDRCQITVSDYGALCEQAAQMPFRFWCPSHGQGLHLIPPEYRVWNGHGARDGTISLFDPPKGPRLPLAKAPPHPLLDGYVIPYGKDDLPLPDLKLTAVTGTCEVGTGMPGYPRAYPDRYPIRCSWHPAEFTDSCFSPQETVEAGDTVFCPDAPWVQRYDPMSFFAVKVTEPY
jgi:hypothetical protein